MHLGEALKGMRNLKVLHLDSNPISDAGREILSELFGSSRFLEAILDGSKGQVEADADSRAW